MPQTALYSSLEWLTKADEIEDWIVSILIN